MSNPIQYMVCSECAPIIANGDATHLDIYSEETAGKMLVAIETGMAEVQERDSVYLSIGSADNYLHYSTKPCEVCGCKRAGERIEAIGVPKHIVKVA